jgi:hypothetical protein
MSRAPRSNVVDLSLCVEQPSDRTMIRELHHAAVGVEAEGFRADRLWSNRRASLFAEPNLRRHR